MALSVVSFSFPRAAQLEAQGLSFLLSAGFLYHILSATSLDPNSIGGPEGPFDLVWLSLPHLVSISNSNSNSLTSVLTELYNSSSSTQSPNQSLEWHVWLSSSGNNCHAVQRSLSSDASVYECIMGFFPCPILLARSTYAIFPHKCHRNVSLPSGASLWNGKFGRVEGQNTTLDMFSSFSINSNIRVTTQIWLIKQNGGANRMLFKFL